MLKLSLLFIWCLSSVASFGQCLNDDCQTAEQVQIPVIINSCNYDCTQDINDITLYNGFICSYHNFNMWYSFDLNQDTFLCIEITSDYTFAGAVNGNYGMSEGIEFFIYNSCNDIIFGSNCYWMSNIVHNITTYDPTRQEWSVTLYLPAGQYIFEVDGFGWSTGCFELMLCGENLLGLDIEEYRWNKNQRMFNYDILGRRIR